MVGIQKQSSYININVIENSSTRETGLLHYTDAIFSPYRLSFRGALSSKFVCYAARVTYDPLNSLCGHHMLKFDYEFQHGGLSVSVSLRLDQEQWSVCINAAGTGCLPI